MCEISPSYKIEFPTLVQLDNLPDVIKCKDYDAILESNSIIKKAEEESVSILNRAKCEAQEILSEAKNKLDEIEQDAYLKGVERVQVESVEHVFKMSEMTTDYLRDNHERLIDIVYDSVKHIVYQFDDLELVKKTLQKAVDEFEDSRKLILWVSSDLRNTLDDIFDDMFSDTVLSIRADPDLSGSQCKVDNGRMVLLGDVSTQVESVRAAMRSHFERNRLKEDPKYS